MIRIDFRAMVTSAEAAGRSVKLGMVRMRWISSLLVMTTLIGAARADPVASADPTAIRGAIDGQIQAFRSNDAPAAFSYASPGIKAHFPDATQFLAMVRAAYPAVFRPRSYRFAGLEADPDHPRILVQKVEFFGPDGDASQALYAMEHEPDGRWLIDGCVLITNPHIET
ncbi:DUF4864 domain-containing protein [Lichenicola sp.]|uniref:DUF4864 domain-containing protein n=1 Tax=Lichenicola sp. TaxID=2804529 RepID=UPI003B00FF3B